MIQDVINGYNKALAQLLATGKYDKSLIYGNTKSFLYTNRDTEEVKKARQVFGAALYEIYNTKELTEALNGSDEYPYAKIINIYKNDPERFYTELKLFFQETVYIPEGHYPEDNINWFIEDCGLEHVDNLDKLRDFYKANRNLGPEQEYGSYEEERKRFLNAKNNHVYGLDYEKFLMEQKSIEAVFGYWNEEDTKISYLDKKLGNMGELYLYDTLVVDKETCFVARDLGNGFGYDIYTTATQNGVKKEFLFEVKTTTIANKDYFILSANEKKTMVDTLSKDKTEYMICLAYINAEENRIMNSFLKAVDENTFINTATDEIFEFEKTTADNGYVFVGKQKVLKK